MSARGLSDDILAVLDRRAETRLLSVLARDGRETAFTGAAIAAAAGRMQTLWSACLGPGPKVLIAALPPGETFLTALTASLLGAGTLVPVALPRVTDPPDRLHRMATGCGAAAALCLSRNRAAVEAQLRDAAGKMACPVLALDAPEVCAVSRNSGRALADVPIVQHTSGSTRFPKPVPVGADQIRANCALIRSLWGMGPETVMVSWLPQYHDMGLMGGILYPLLCGARSVQMNPFDMIRSPLSWLEAISDHRATMSGGPAFAFQDCLSRIAPDAGRRLDLSRWERAFCGAEPVPAGLLERFAARFAPNGLRRSAVFACYGMAETTLFAAGEPDPRHDRAPSGSGSSGLGPSAPAAPPDSVPAGWRRHEGCRLSQTTRQALAIVDPETGAPLPEGAEGEIWLSGASLVTGYLGQPGESACSFVTDAAGRRWLRTGDLGGIAGGRLFVTGRCKDIVIVNGRNVAAAEIEWIAARQDPALNPSGAAAVVPEGSEAGHAVLHIEVRAGRAGQMPADCAALESRIRRAVLGGCGVTLDAVHILRRGSLPRTTSGKIRRSAVLRPDARAAPADGETV